MTPPDPQSTHELMLSHRLLERVRKQRLTGDSGTVLLIDARYHLQREIARAFARQGWRVVTVPIQLEETYVERLLTAIIFHQPDLLFTINHLGIDKLGAIRSLIEQVELPVVSWFVDSPAYILLDHPGAVSSFIMTPVWERTEIKTLERLGFEGAFYLPLATDPQIMARGIGVPKKAQIGFVGDSMESASAKWRALCPDGVETGRLLDLSVNSLLTDRSNQVNTEELPAAWDEATRLNFASAAVLEATRRYRQNSLKELSGLPLQVWGDEGWRFLESFGAKIANCVDYYRELPLAYGENLVNINFTSLQMPTTVNQRVFDVPAAGGFLLTDDQEDLYELFEPDEFETFESTNELKSKASWYLRNPEKAEVIRQRALDRILGCHTYSHRIESIIVRARERFSNTHMSISQ